MHRPILTKVVLILAAIAVMPAVLMAKAIPPEDMHLIGYYWPVKGSPVISSAFGLRTYPGKAYTENGQTFRYQVNWQDFHNGIDIPVRTEPIMLVMTAPIWQSQIRFKAETKWLGNVIGTHTFWYCHLDDSHTAAGVNNSNLPPGAKGLVWKIGNNGVLRDAKGNPRPNPTNYFYFKMQGREITVALSPDAQVGDTIDGIPLPVTNTSAMLSSQDLTAYLDGGKYFAYSGSTSNKIGGVAEHLHLVLGWDIYKKHLSYNPLFSLYDASGGPHKQTLLTNHTIGDPKANWANDVFRFSIQPVDKPDLYSIAVGIGNQPEAPSLSSRFYETSYIDGLVYRQGEIPADWNLSPFSKNIGKDAAPVGNQSFTSLLGVNGTASEHYLYVNRKGTPELESYTKNGPFYVNVRVEDVNSSQPMIHFWNTWTSPYTKQIKYSVADIRPYLHLNSPGQAAVKSFCFSQNGIYDMSAIQCTKCADPLNATLPECKKDRCPKGTICDSSPPGDHADDNYDLFTFGESEIDLNSYRVDVPYPVKVAARGYAGEANYLLSTNFDWHNPIDLENISAVSALDTKLLIIPSGGLSNLASSSNIRVGLDEYVKAGGTLIVFGQEFGSAFAALPGGQVKGYGWLEDQACFSASSYIDTWHTILSGQTSSSPSVNVDGYFTSIPDNATVLLRRKNNSQPVLIVYPYGNGKVIASTLYSDWALAHGQASMDEVNLVRDMVAWAQNTASGVPETPPGGTITATIPVTNNSGVDATPVVTLLSPDGKVGVAQTVATQPIPTGTQTQMTVTYATPPDASTGVYIPAYHLLDTSGDIVYPRESTDTGRVAVVTRPPAGVGGSGLGYSIQSNGEHFVAGSNVTFTFNFWNNGNTARTLRVDFSGFGQRGFKNITIPAQGMNSFTYTASSITASDRMVALYYDESGQQMGTAEKWVWVEPVQVMTTIELDKALYQKGETLTASLSAFNMTDTAVSGGSIHLQIKNGAGQVVDTANTTLDLPGQTIGTAPATFNSRNYSAGTHTLQMQVLDANGAVIGSGFTTFTMAEPRFMVSAPQMMTAGGLASLELTNTGDLPNSPGSALFELLDPAGTVVWSDRPSIPALAPGEKLVLRPTLPVADKFGIYYFRFRLEYNGKVQQGRIPMESAAIADITLDKSVYRVRETATLTYRVRNTGKFFQHLTAGVSIPGIAYQQNRTVDLKPGEQSAPLVYAVPIPASASAGIVEVNAALALPGSRRSSLFSFTIPPSDLVIRQIPRYSALNAGDPVPVGILNPGGVDTAYVIDELSLRDGSGVYYSSSTATPVSLLAGGVDQLTLPIPGQARSGEYYLTVAATDIATNKKKSSIIPIAVSGQNAGLRAQTDRPLYQASQSATGLTQLLNGTVALADASMTLTVEGRAPANGVPTAYLPKEPSYPYNRFERALAVSPAGLIYAAGGGLSTGGVNGALQWFDAGGRYLDGINNPGIGDLVWGPDGNMYATGPGTTLYKLDAMGRLLAQWNLFQWDYSGFGDPVMGNAIVVATDGSVFVADTAGEIQKFTPDGQLVRRWPVPCSVFSYGSPERIRIGRDGLLYVLETLAGRVEKYDPDGNRLSGWFINGTGPTADYREYTDFDFGADGNLLLVHSRFDSSLWQTIATVEKYSPDGRFLGNWNDAVFPSTPKITADNRGNVFLYPQNELLQGAGILMYDGNGYQRNYFGAPAYTGEQFFMIADMAAGASGHLYVLDAGGVADLLKHFDSNGNFVRTLSNTGTGSGQFAPGPGGLAAGNGAIYVADTYNNRIQKFGSDDRYVAQWGVQGSGSGQFLYPQAVAVGPDGSVYVADTGNNRIQKFDADGSYLAQWGQWGSGDGQFSGPMGIAVAGDGTVYVADTNNARIQSFDNTGRYIAQWGSYGTGDSQFIYPYKVAVGNDGSVYVDDTWNYKVKKFDGTGKFLAAWNTSGALSISKTGTIYIANGDSAILSMPENAHSSNILWSKTLPVNQPANLLQSFTDLIGTLNVTGKFYFKAALSNVLGQELASADYPFYIFDGDLAVTIAPDKPVYKPGDPITLSGQIINSGTAAVTLSLDIATVMNGVRLPVYTQIITVPAGGSVPFVATSTAVSSSGSGGGSGSGGRQCSGPTPAYCNQNIVVTVQGCNAGGTLCVFNRQNAYALLPIGDTAPSSGTLSDAVSSESFRVAAVQTGTPLLTLQDAFAVMEPQVTATLTAPELVDRDAFDLVLELKNPGAIEASIQATVSDGNWSDSKAYTLVPGETKLVSYPRNIASDTAYTVTVTGDASASAAKNVLYGEGAVASVAALPVYAEGQVEIPVTLTGKGRLQSTVNARYILTDGAGAVVKELARTHLLPASGTATDALTFDLPEGNYTLAYSSEFWNNSTQFQVKKADHISVAVTPGIQAGGQVPLAVTVTNDGLNPYTGTADVQVGSWLGSADVANLAPGQTQTFNLFIPVSLLGPGDNSVRVTGLTADGIFAGSLSQPASLAATAPDFIITRTPVNAIITAGQPGILAFNVRNTGTLAGNATLTLKLGDAVNALRTITLAPGEEKTVNMPVLMPADLEEKSYDAGYTLSDGTKTVTQGQVRFYLQGVKVTVTASLDKPYYKAGDTARLILNVTGNNLADLYARVNYGGYEAIQPVGGAITFNIPISQFTGQKLFYGIYHKSGRSIHLNALYLYPEEQITIVTGRQVYNAGDTVSYTASGPATPGTMTVSGPGGYSQSRAFSGTGSGSFTLPAVMTSGTYYVRTRFTASAGGQSSLPGVQADVPARDVTGSHPFDVKGTEVKILQTALDKTIYNAKDTVSGTLMINSNQNIPATLKVWSVSSEGEYTLIGMETIQLSASQNIVYQHQWPFESTSAGTHSIIFRLYGKDGKGEPLFLASTSKAFDVGSGTLLAIRTDKGSYPAATEPVTVMADLNGTGSGTVSFYLDDQPVGGRSVTLNGFTRIGYQLPSSVTPGPHTLKAVYAAGGLTSSKFSEFSYGTDLPDLEVRIYPAGLAYPNYRIGVTVTNKGKMASQPTSVPVYDGDPKAGVLIGTVQVPAIKPFESMNFTLDWNIAGKMGTPHQLFGQVNGDLALLELNNSNNSANISFTLPVDTTPPTFTAGLPAADKFINLRTPSITATLWDDPDGVGVDPASIQLLVDGQRVPAQYSPDTGEVSATAPALADGPHQVSLSAKDYVGNPASAAWSFRVDATPPEISNLTPAGGSLLKTVLPKISANITDAGIGLDFSAVQVTLDGYLISRFDSKTGILGFGISQPLARGSHLLQVNAKDLLGNAASATATFAVDAVPLGVTAALDHSPRVLAWVNTPNPAQDQNAQLARSTLEASGVTCKIVYSKDEFKTGLRSNKYNTYLLLTSPEASAAAAEMVDVELAEQVNSGRGLVASVWSDPYKLKENRDDHEKLLSPVELDQTFHLFGVEFKKALEDRPRTLAYGTSLTQSLSLAGPIFRVVDEEDGKDSSTQVTAVIREGEEHEKPYPGIVYHPYGKGKTVLFTFDPGQSPFGGGQENRLAALLKEAIAYASPKEETILPGMEVPVVLTVESLEVPVRSRLEVVLPDGVTLAGNPDNGISSGNLLNWTLDLEAKERRTLRYTMRISRDDVSVPVDTGVWFLTFNDTYHQQEILPLAVSIAEGSVARTDRIRLNLDRLREPVIKEEYTADQVLSNLAQLLAQPLDPEKDILKNLEKAGLKHEREYHHEDPAAMEILNTLRLDLDYLMESKELELVHTP